MEVGKSIKRNFKKNTLFSIDGHFEQFLCCLMREIGSKDKYTL